MINPRNILWALPLLLVLTGSLWWPPVSEFLSPPGKSPAPQVAAGQQAETFSMEEVFFTQCNKGKEELVVRASRLYNGKREQTIQMENVRATLIDRDDKQTRINSNNAFYNIRKKVLTLADNVQVFTADGYDLRTSVLRYLADTRQAETSEQVELAGKNMEITGTGLLYDLVSGDFKLGGRVRVSLN